MKGARGMKKDTFYFSHDSNARHDPKILAMRSVYGAEGYGWYWMLIEMLREEPEHKLRISGKYICDAYAMQMQCDRNTVEKFLQECIEEFELFKSDGEYFWSESLIRRMQEYHEKSEKAKAAARSRWDNKTEQCNSNADAMQTHSECIADGMPSNQIKSNQNISNNNSSSKAHPDIKDVIRVYGEKISEMVSDNDLHKLNQMLIAYGKDKVIRCMNSCKNMDELIALCNGT